MMHIIYMFRGWLLVLAALGGPAYAVTVPPGVELAESQVLRRGNGSEPGTLDPHRAEGNVSAHIQRDLYEGLTAEDVAGHIVPGVAERWEISDNGRIYTFYLRKNARWSNGDPVTAEDFVFSLRRSVDPATGSAYSQMLAPILNAAEIIADQKPPESLGVRAGDPHILEIELNGPTPYLPGLLAHSAAYPVHAPSLKAHGERFSRPGKLIGNGAFKLTEWVVNDHILVERNPYYWDNANTVIDKVYFYPLEDQSTDLKRYRAGEVDWTFEIPNSQFKWIKDNLGAELHVAPMLATYYYGFNLTRPPFKDHPKLRQALSMAIDRAVIAEKVAGAGEVPAWSMVPPGVEGYTPHFLPYKTLTREARLAEARRLYEEAGYSKSRPLSVELRYNTSENHKKIAVAVASMWKKNLGVQTQLLNEEWKVFLENRKARVVTQVMRDGWNGDYNDAYTFLELFQSEHGLNYAGYADPKYDRLLAEAAQEGDPLKRAALMREAEGILLADHPLMPIYHYVSKRLVKPYVGNYRPSIMDHPYSKHHYIIKH